MPELPVDKRTKSFVEADHLVITEADAVYEAKVVALCFFLQKSLPVKKIFKKNLMRFDRHRKMPVRFTDSVACRHHRPG